MPAPAFVDALNEQIGYEFSASQQYIALAVYYDSQTLPRLGGFFYRQSLEERDHALMMVRYLLDSGAPVRIPGTEPPSSDFDDVVAPLKLAQEQERRVSDQIAKLAALAREHSDYASEQFIQWFVKEQVEEVSTMSALVTIGERCRDDIMELEEYVERELGGASAEDPTAPPVAGA